MKTNHSYFFVFKIEISHPKFTITLNNYLAYFYSIPYFEKSTINLNIH